MTRFLWLMASIVCLALLLWWSLGRPQETVPVRARPAIPVTVAIAQLRDFQDVVAALGTLRAWESIDITPSVSQVVTRVAFDDAQQVQRGDVLALLKQDAEQATLRELQATLADADREARRLENLAKQNQVAQTELDKARTRQEVTTHKIEEVRARIADRTIVAPFSGVLGLRHVSPGALVVPGQRLTTLDDISRMRLEFAVPATRLGFLRVGQAVTARAAAFEEPFSGVIAALDSRVDPATRAITALAVVENPEFVLRPGLLVEVEIQGPQRRALLLPEESLQSRATQHYVWRVSEQTAQRIPVVIGWRTPGWVEIVEGLQAGDAIVRDGVGRLSGDAAVITVVED